MLSLLWVAIGKALEHNQFLSGGAILMALGAAGALARKLPGQARDALIRRYTTTVDLAGNDPAFGWTQRWLAAQPYSGRAGSLSATTRVPVETEEPGPEPRRHRPEILFTPAPGSHWLKHRGRWVHVLRERSESHNQNFSSWDFFEKMTVRVFSRDRNFVRRLMDEIRDFALPPDDARATIYGVQYDDWTATIRVPVRPPRSVVLAQGLLDDLLADVDRFAGSREWYRSRSIPYRRGYLLHGPPGNGKTSLVSAVAAHLGWDVAILSFGGDDLTDGKLRRLLCSVPERSLLLIEDVDRDLADLDGGRVEGGKLTFGAILNAMDGIAAPEGRILFFTTNRRDRLDESLVRPGRIDRDYHLGNATTGQARELFLRFFPGEHRLAAQFARAVGDVSVAAIQGHLLTHHADPVAAVEAAMQAAEVPA